MRSTAFKVAARLSLNFLSAHTEWVTNQNKSEATVVIYLDNAKAFGIVIYSKLLHKLYAYGIRDDLLKWFENFIGSHTQAVKINGVLTDFLPVTSGVVQGSVYGSQLFKLYINNLPEVIPPAVKVYLLADDTKLTKIIRTIACRQLNVTGSSLFCSVRVSAMPTNAKYYKKHRAASWHIQSNIQLSSIWPHPRVMGSYQRSMDHRKQSLAVSQVYRKHNVSGCKEILYC